MSFGRRFHAPDEPLLNDLQTAPNNAFDFL